MTSRRELRPTPSRGAATSRKPGLRASRWVPRTAVLTALATATIGLPVADALSPEDQVPNPVAQTVDDGYPSAHEVLSSLTLQTTPTSLLAAVQGVSQVSGGSSRSLERDPLPGCDGQPRPGGANGQIPASDLCTLWDGNHMLRGDAAVAIAELNQNFRAVFSRDLCLTDSYRTLASQRRLIYQKPGLAATPGRSNHGWGLAVDLCSSETGSSTVMQWLLENGPTYGWDNPDWARSGGSGPYEPWHWEYFPGTDSMGSTNG
ncbi:M15 family metallopeptidase [Actinotalea sp. BY-33]|uniref:M15 family metallopeptidase n=1 Tax=Actinotalea soli TaxID=2819234 RepID=A0A939RV84_9CELL|nr:M15 family metallopeptidase [Actinotalea soli]MBO1750881.1 M15 family metallopeptidase [Actinotalea soli]